MGKHDRRGAQKGVALILFTMFLVVILSIGALAIATSFLQVDKQRAQNVANLSALAAMQELGKNTPGQPIRPYAERVQNALTAANSIVEGNSLYGNMGRLLLGNNFPQQNNLSPVL